MRILLISDEEDKLFWDFFDKSYFTGIDLIISCGDLKPNYLSFLCTLVPVPLLYVHGNHDGRYEVHPPEGCICIEDDIYVYHGVRILGLGGCMEYNFGPHQYTEETMEKRIKRLKMRYKLWKNKGFDILVAHAPAKDFHDDRDRCHQGFQVFRDLIERYEPAYFVHGHVHMAYGRQFPREDMLGKTKVVNAYDKYIIEI